MHLVLRTRTLNKNPEPGTRNSSAPEQFSLGTSQPPPQRVTYDRAMNDIVDFINVHRDRYVEELKQYLAIPSISALPEHAADVRRAAEWTGDALRSAGLEHVALMETPGNPVVYGDWLHAPGKPTLLFYGHYDVQPVDPVNLWTSPPF